MPITIHPNLDVWPHVRWINGQFCYDDMIKNDGSLQIGDYEFKLTKRQDNLFLRHGVWDVYPWNGSFTHVKILYGNSTVLHFIPRRIMTKAGVFLRNPFDVAEFFYAGHNEMLYKEQVKKPISC